MPASITHANERAILPMVVFFWGRSYHRMIVIDVERLVLKDLRAGADFTLTMFDAGANPEYRFTIKVRSMMPLCEVELLDPYGEVEAVQDVILLGSGRPTAGVSNPLLKGDWFMDQPFRDSAVMPRYGHLVVGENVMIADPNNDIGAWHDLSMCTQIQARDSVS